MGSIRRRLAVRRNQVPKACRGVRCIEAWGSEGRRGRDLVRELDGVAHVQHDEGAGEAVLEVPEVAGVEAAVAVLDVVYELEGVVHDGRDLHVDTQVIVLVAMVHLVERMASPATAARHTDRRPSHS